MKFFIWIPTIFITNFQKFNLTLLFDLWDDDSKVDVVIRINRGSKQVAADDTHTRRCTKLELALDMKRPLNQWDLHFLLKKPFLLC